MTKKETQKYVRKPDLLGGPRLRPKNLIQVSLKMVGIMQAINKLHPNSSF
jgi:hypothetical protein